jgi:hypothetical protein
VTQSKLPRRKHVWGQARYVLYKYSKDDEGLVWYIMARGLRGSLGRVVYRARTFQMCLDMVDYIDKRDTDQLPEARSYTLTLGEG